MIDGAERFVPKVHPTARAVEPEDPLALHAEAAPGDPEVMLECLVQEFVWMGWDTDGLLTLFHHPAYPVLNRLVEHFGEEAVRRRVGALRQRWDVLRFRETVADEPDPDPEEGELIPLSLERIVSGRPPLGSPSSGRASPPAAAEG